MSDLLKYITLTIFLLIVFLLMWILRDGLPKGQGGYRGPIVEPTSMRLP